MSAWLLRRGRVPHSYQGLGTGTGNGWQCLGVGGLKFAVTEYPGQTVTPCWERSAHPAHENPSVLKAVPTEQPAAELIFILAFLSPQSQALQTQHVLSVCCGVVGTDLIPLCLLWGSWY